MIPKISRAALALLIGAHWSAAYAHDSSAGAKRVANQKEKTTSEEVDTEHIFGFTEGSDLGEAGAKELELVSSGRFGKQSGFYAASSTALFYKYSVTDHLRVAPIVSFSSHNITNVPGPADKSQLMLEGTGAEIRYRLWDREKGPIGLTLSATPFFSRVDAIGGTTTEEYSVEAAILVDKEIIPGRLFAAFNVAYEPELSRPGIGSDWQRASTFG